MYLFVPSSSSDDYNEYKRNIEVCKELTHEYGFTWGRCKWAHKSDIPCDSKRRTYEHGRYDICKSVAQAMAKIKDIKQLPQRLALDGSGVTGIAAAWAGLGLFPVALICCAVVFLLETIL